MNSENRPALKVYFLKRFLGQFGGLEKYTHYLSNAFAKRGHDVTFICSTAKGDQKLDDKIQIETLNTSPLLSYRKIQAFDSACQNWLQKNPADIVFGMDRTSEQTHIRAGNGVHRAFMERRKSIDSWLKTKTYFLNPTNKYILDIERKSFENPNLKKLFTNSNMVKDEVLQYYNVDPTKIEVIHNGVEYDDLLPYFENWEETKNETLQEFDLPKDMHHMLFIGNGYQRKGLGPLMKALSQLRQYPFHLYVIGKERNLSAYRKEACNLGLKDHISFLGSQPNILKYYALADTCVIPSFYDPFANVTVEALAMGVFVISSKFNGGHEVLTPQNGSIIPSLYDIDSFVETLKARLTCRKTKESAQKIRNSVAHLNFEAQLNKMIDSCLEI
ncbi:MAG: glycosyltransferase family 4 protein [Rhabdochlamydiaceae bacterium]|nr:glycosyltransferase family 4 protein [Candidatus Amphrikana amoebophyrae]